MDPTAMPEEEEDSRRMTLAEWAEDLGINNWTDHSEDDVTMSKSAALGKLERAALARKMGKLGSWIGRKINGPPKHLSQPTIDFARLRASELKEEGSPELGRAISAYLGRHEGTRERDVVRALDDEITYVEGKLEEYKAAKDFETWRQVNAYRKLLKALKAEKKLVPNPKVPKEPWQKPRVRG